MRVLVACEFSQVVTKAFRERGHEAYSCDLLPTEGNPEWHIQDDVLKHLDEGWEMMIAHPPCNYISYAGTGAWDRPGRVFKRLEALQFFAKLWEAPIKKICLENPKSCASPVIAKYTQEIQPFYFGDPHIKTVWLWLRGLPPLVYSKCDDLFSYQTATERPLPLSVDNTTRQKKRYYTDAKVRDPKERARFWSGIANAMATQWG